MTLRYRPDAYALHVQTIRTLVPGLKVSGLTCQQCHDRRQLLFCHPDNPNLWLCNTCMHFAPASHGQYQLSALARAQSALEHAATAFLDPQPHSKRERVHDDTACLKSGIEDATPNTEASQCATLTARTVNPPLSSSSGSPHTTPVSPRAAATTPAPLSTPRLRPPTPTKGTKSRSRHHKPL